MNEREKSITILMAEDDVGDRLLVKEALKEAGWDHELCFVPDGEELMDYLHHRGRYVEPALSPRPGLILLDLNMPKKDGREALAEIKGDPNLRSIPVVVLTTSEAERDIVCAYELGVNSYITKPVAFEELVEVMKVLHQFWFQTVKLPPVAIGVRNGRPAY